MKAGDFYFFPEQRLVIIHKQEIYLTTKEFGIFR